MIRPLVALLLCTTSAYALEMPAPGTADPCMRSVAYNPADRVDIITNVDSTLSIEFGPIERIKLITMGKNDGPVGGPDPKDTKAMFNHLPLWGVAVGTTNVIVTTLSGPDDHTESVYQFLVHVKPALKDSEANPLATCGLKFTYAAQERQIAVQQAHQTWAQKKAEADRQKAEARLAVDFAYGKRNWKYVAIGDSSIAPYEASDNYRITAFRYPGNTEKPSVFIADGGPWCDLKHQPPKSWLQSSEHTAQVNAKDDLIIVKQTAEHFRIRLGAGYGGRTVDISNCGYDAVGVNPGTGTTSPEVIRESRMAQQ